MAVRNGMPYLPATLASLEAQTYSNHALLVWDNGSTDDTVAELRRWIPSRLPGRIITGRPLGLGASLAALVETAETEYCARIDADDIAAPTRLDKQIAFLQAHPKVVAVGTQVEFMDEDDRPMENPWVFPTEDAEVRWGTRWRPLNLHPTLLLRRTKMLEAGNYRDCKPMEDHDILIRLSLLGPMPNLPEQLYRWRRHSGSITTRIPDHHDYHREGARMNADVLFPGVPASQAMRLWDLLYNLSRPEPARLSDLRLLHRAAKALAVAAGENENYFVNTSLYSAQRYHLRQRAAASLGLAPLLSLKHKLRSAILGARTPTAGHD
jgi:glycosyltransferase involved in cell wall biosynthesis